MIIKSINDIETLQESFDIECKLATGKDGKGKLPKDFWPTYSAFANSYGGDIFLGIKEKKGHFFIDGIKNTQSVIDEIFSTVNNSNKVSFAIISDKDVSCITLENKTIIQVHIPRARREERPIFINNNPLKGTYKRRNSGDQLCREVEVKRMLSEQLNESRDNSILKGFDLFDIDNESLKSFRNLLSSTKSSHPWLSLDDKEFLRNIGAWKRNRENSEEGLTIAGLLMFGKLPSIQDALPNYMLDYQEREESKSSPRWVDRITLDGTWSGNIFDFYKKVYSKLISDLKNPFQLNSDQRQDENIVHISLREALVNCLVHADYSERIPVLIVKRPDMFGFRNPGLMRISVEDAIAGGVSDCRNRTIHQMFLLVGLGERAGSGISKIFHGWESKNWTKPHLYEKEEPAQTLLELHMGDLIDEKIANKLKALLGELYDNASPDEKYILSIIEVDEFSNHKRLLELTSHHPHDLSVILGKMVRKNMLTSSGRGKGKMYHISGKPIHKPSDDGLTIDVFVKIPKFITSDLSDKAGVISDGTGVISDGTGVISDGTGIVKLFNMTTQKLENNDEVWNKLEKIAKPISTTKRITNQEIMESTILEIYQEYFVPLKALQILLARDGKALRRKYLSKMVKEGKLNLAYPAIPNSPKQAYSVHEPPALVTM